MALIGRVILIPEDRDVRVLERFCRHAARWADPESQPHRLFPSDYGTDRVVNRRDALGEPPNLWRAKTPGGRRRRNLLVRDIAAHISADPRNLVVFHVDADCAWSERSGSNEVELEKLMAEIAHRMDVSVQAVSQQVLRAIPHWCIEAWALQNLDAGAKLPVPPGMVPLPWVTWRDDRRALDEVPFPKALWVGSEHNLALAASGWPASEVVEAGTSFAAFAAQWSSAPALALLAETRAPHP